MFPTTIVYVKVITPYECYIKFIITEHEDRRPEGEVIINLIWYSTSRRVIINIFHERQNLCWCLMLLLPFCQHFGEGKRCFLVVCFDGRFYIWPLVSRSQTQPLCYATGKGLVDLMYISSSIVFTEFRWAISSHKTVNYIHRPHVSQ